MSYEIMYNWQFLRSAEGISPVILTGSNNVTTTHWSPSGRSVERCAREWWCLFNQVGMSEDEFFGQIKAMTGKPFQEHWKKGGKWVDDAALVRWAKKAVEEAASIEDILLLNRPSSLCVEGYVSVWPKKGEDGWSKKFVSRSIRTTEELDDWIRDARTVMEKARDEGRDVFPIIRFSREEFIHYKPLPEKIILKRGKAYIKNIELKNGFVHGVSFTPYAKEAEVFARDEYFDMLRHNNCAMLCDVRPFSAEVAQYPYDAAIMITRLDTGKHEFVSKLGKAKLFVTGSLAAAQRFKNLHTAQKTAQKLAEKYDAKRFSFEAFAF